MSRAAPGPDPGAVLPSLRLLSRQPAEAAAGSEEQQQGQQPQARLERLELEMDTGKGGAWGVMNITGEVFGWSLSSRVANSELPGVSACPVGLPACLPVCLPAGCHCQCVARMMTTQTRNSAACPSPE